MCRALQDEGDPANDVSPRDLVFTLPADEATSPSAAPRQLAATNLRYGGISWGDDNLALIYESWWKTRRSIICTFAPDRPQDGLKVGGVGAMSGSCRLRINPTHSDAAGGFAIYCM